MVDIQPIVLTEHGHLMPEHSPLPPPPVPAPQPYPLEPAERLRMLETHPPSALEDLR